MQPNKVTTDNIPKEYQTAQLNNYVNTLQQPVAPAPTPIRPPAPLPTQAISAADISNPQQPVQLPNVNTSNVTTTANQIASSAQSKLDADILNATKEAEAVQKAGGNQADVARTNLLSSVKNLLSNKTDALKNQGQLEEQAGLSNEIKAKNEINTEIANTQVELRREQDRIRTAGMSKGQAQVEEGAVADTYGRRLADLAIRQAAATGNIEAIKSEAQRKTKLVTDAIDNDITYFKDFESQNVDALDKKQKEKLALIVDNLGKKKEEAKKLEEAKAQMLMEISNNGGGTNTALVKRIQEAGSIGDVYGIASGSGFIGKLDRELKSAQISKVIQDTANSGVKNAPQMIAEQANIFTQEGNPKTNKEVIASILATDLVKAGTKARLAPANAVMNSIEEFSAQRQGGEFVGVGLFGRAKEFYKGFVDKTNPQATENWSNLSALNLKTQQWASGASLSPEQTKEVMKMVPNSTDSDKKVRTKLNQLYNYMANNVESELLTDGVNINFKPVNLFENMELINQASPEQLQQLRAQGLIQ